MPHIDNTQKRLLSLYALNQVGGGITKEQASTVLVRTTPLTWFEIQETLNDLLKDRLLERYDQSQKLSITPNGISVIDVYAGQIPENIRKAIDSYVAENREALAREIGVVANLKSQDGAYQVTLKLSEGSVTLMEVTLTAPTRSSAESICAKWKANPVEKYSELLRIFSD